MNTKTINLTWQPSLHNTRYVVGMLTRELGRYSFAYVPGKDLNDAQKLGFKGYPAFPHFDQTYTQNVIESFGSRIPPRSRSDFKTILKMWEIDDENISDFDFLAITGGQLATDLFLFVDPHNEKMPTTFLARVAGFVHHIDVPVAKQMAVGESLSFIPEDGNKYDPFAVHVAHSGRQIGYLNKIHARRVRQALTEGAHISGQLSHLDVNGVVNLVLARIFIKNPVLV